MKTKYSITLILFVLLSEFNSYSQEIWTPTSQINYPSARIWHTAVWTGSKMIIWGGQSGGVEVNTGGIYDPVTDSWSATSINKAPVNRELHKAVWTGSKMIVWGGWYFEFPNLNYPDSGGVYNPELNSWTSTSVVNAPSGRIYHTLIWTGSKMIVWGGATNSGLSNTGKLYDPITDTWTNMSAVNAPAERDYHTTVWTGSKMIVWGGEIAGNIPVNTGGIYDPVQNSWTQTSITNAPEPRIEHSAVWTGSKMIVWGGSGSGGGIYDPEADTWVPTSLINEPLPRIVHTAVWTGIKMIVWGGLPLGSFAPTKTGGVYDPATNTWTATTLTYAPAARVIHTAIWTGNKMIVWGGEEPSGLLASGGIYYNSGVIGIENSGTEVPASYKLYQNYPNPFNPSTKIKASLGPSEGGKQDVKLVIYDILGKDIAVFIPRRSLTANGSGGQEGLGIYEIEWDGNNYPSGIYFYRLIIDDKMIDTKKMILLK